MRLFYEPLFDHESTADRGSLSIREGSKLPRRYGAADIDAEKSLPAVPNAAAGAPSVSRMQWASPPFVTPRRSSPPSRGPY